MRELRGPKDLLLVRDAAPILYVPAATWHCVLCDPENKGAVSTTTVVWLGRDTDGPSGRCSSCGQKYELVNAADRHVPAPDEQKWPHS